MRACSEICKSFPFLQKEIAPFKPTLDCDQS